MDILKYKDYEGSAELDMSRGVCRGKILFIDDLVTYESTYPSGLQAEFEAAVDDYIETCISLGKEPSRPFRGQFNVRVRPELHRSAALRALNDHVSLNEVIVRALTSFLDERPNANQSLHVMVMSREVSLKTVTSAASKEFKWEPLTHVH